MKTVIQATLIELKKILKEPWILLIIIGAPLLYPFVYNSAYVSRHETEVPVAICDLDRSGASRAFIRSIEAHELSSLYALTPSPDEAMTLLKQGEVTGVFLIPKGFEKNSNSLKRTTIRAWISFATLMQGSDLSKALSDCIGSMNRTATAKRFASKGMNSVQALRTATPIQTTLSESGNVTNSYGDFMIPALLILIFQQSLAAGTAVSVARDRRSHAHHLPESTVSAILGRVLPYWILFGIHAILLFALQFRIWQIPFEPNLLLLISATLLFIATTSFYGVIIGSVFKNPISALLIVMFSTYPIYLLTGYAWPKEMLPPIYQAISSIVPAAPFLQICGGTGLLHGSFADLSDYFKQLGLIAIGSGVVAFTILKLLWRTPKL